MNWPRALPRHPISRLAPRTLRRGCSGRRGHPPSLVPATRTSEQLGIRGRLRVAATFPPAAAHAPRSAPAARQRWVWNASYMDEDQARDLERRIQDQIRSLDRIQEEISATCSSTQRDELERLKAQQRQRKNQLGQLLDRYKKVAGEEYHGDPSVAESSRDKG